MEPMEVEQQPEQHQYLQANQNIHTSRGPKYKDALSYVRAVKSTFGKNSEVYKQFLEITRDIRKDTVETSVIIARVTDLFRGHAKFSNGFNLFLPSGYAMPVEAPADQPLCLATANEDLFLPSSYAMPVEAPAEQPLCLAIAKEDIFLPSDYAMPIEAPGEQPLCLAIAKEDIFLPPDYAMPIEAPADQTFCLAIAKKDLFLPPDYAMPIEAPTDQPLCLAIAKEDRRT